MVLSLKQSYMSNMVKDAHGYDVKVPSQGQANFNTVGAAGGLGWIAEKTGILNGVLGGNGGWNHGCASPMDMPVSRYEMSMENALAQKDTEIALLKSNIYTDSKITDAYKDLRGQIAVLQDFAARQSVQNQAFMDSFADVRKDVDYKVQLEAERRQCADCKVVNYVNSTFAPKLITDYTAGTTSAVAQVYNPLGCGSGCVCGNIYAGPQQ